MKHPTETQLDAQTGKSGARYRLGRWLTAHVLWLALGYVAIAWITQTLLFSCEVSSPRQLLATAAIPGSNDHLIVAYPERINPGLPTPQKPSIAIWVLEASLTATVVITTTSVQPSAPITIIPPARIYELNMEIKRGWANLVNAEGLAALNRVQVTPASVPGTPVVFYLEPASATSSGVVSITARALNDPSQGILALATPMIWVENRYMVLGRRFLALATDPTGVAAALLAIIVGAVVTQTLQRQAEERRQREEEARRQQQEEEHRRRERETVISQALAQLKLKVDQDPFAALILYETLHDQRDFPWDIEEARQRLQDAWQEAAPDWLRRYASLRKGGAWSAARPDAEALLEAHRRGDQTVQNTVYELFGHWLEGLADQATSDEICQSQLKPTLDPWIATPDDGRLIWDSTPVKNARDKLTRQAEGKGWKQTAWLISQTDNVLQGRLQWPCLWPERRPEDTEGFRKLSEHLKRERRLELRFNPFGPEQAELDPLLPDFASLDFVKRMASPRPAIAFGAEGTGKTATAMLLAQRRPGEGPSDDKAFAIYPVTGYRLDVPMTRGDWLDVIESAFAAYHARFLALNPYPFGVFPSYRTAVLMLLLCHYGTAEALLAVLRKEGVESDAVLDRVRAEAQTITGDGRWSEHERVRLLGQTVPPTLEHAYLIVDLELSSKQVHWPMAADNMRSLIELAVPLAQQRIYLKVLLLDQIKDYWEVPKWIEHFDLTWSDEQLRALLDVRFRTTGSFAFSEICDPRSGDPEALLIKRSSGNPRCMIQLGNRLLSRLTETGCTRVIEDDVEAAVSGG